MRYLSVCSDIEAATVAWAPLGWSPVAFSEIEPFPCAVLAHHYPDVPNLGDMTTIAQRILNGEVEAPDVLAGGTPCQAFSVAGLRKSLADERGNLTLKFVEIADAIDSVRVRDGHPPAIVFWENVPGVLSTKDNAFGCFLGALAGEDCELKPPGKRWTDAGCVFGPQRAIAWRVLDAQYFGLAQRRRRVFVVASARDGFDPAAVLFEFDGVRRDTPPRREAREVAPTTPARSSGGGGLGTDFDCDGGLITRAVSLRGREGGGTAELGDDVQNCLRASSGGGDKPHVLIHADPIARCLTTGEAKRQDWETCNFVAHTLRGEGFDASEDGTGRGTPLVPHVVGALACNTGPNGHDAGNFACNQAVDAGHVLPVAAAFHPTQDPISSSDGSTHALGCGSSGGQASVAVALACMGVQPMAVRRLTVVECERLMGFPDGYTAIPWRGKPADQCPDGPRYRSLGNSWAVPVARWIGERINAVEYMKGRK